MKLISTRQCKKILLSYKYTFEFKCNCGNEEEPLNLINYELACGKCKKKYSATNGTIFHNLRFGLLKAMRICQKEYNSSFTSKSSEISIEFKITLKSSRLFLRKIRANKDEVSKILEPNYKKAKKIKKRIKDEIKLSEYFKTILKEESE
jgi:hypothetical protein